MTVRIPVFHGAKGGGGSTKKQIRIKKTKSEDQEKTNKDQTKKQHRGFHSKTGRTETSPGSKKTKCDSKLMKTYGNLENQKNTKPGSKKI